ncbi:MAG: TolC family protein [Deltaproteobacteria bacterium]|jgi:outer membrane protein|nr:TolC family protein [Deltaproteobacteria bacterium]
MPDLSSEKTDFLARPILGPSLVVLLAICLGLFLIGCAKTERQVIDRPFISELVEPSTIFGEATVGDNRSKEAIENIQIPELPHNRPLTLDECLELALKVSPAVDSADQGYLGAMWGRWQAITNFLPTASASYSVSHRDTPASLAGGHDVYSKQVGVTQSVFTGGRNITNYLLSQLGVAAAQIEKVQAREDLLLQVKQAYYSILATEKALAVAKQSVVNLSSHLNVAKNFFDVGMVPRNQVLEAEVELAKAQLEETTQARNLEVNKSRLNILLRRAVNYPIKVKDALNHPKFPLSLDYCMEVSLRDNPEVRLGRNQVESGAKNIDLARSELYPQVTVNYQNSSSGSTPRAHGGLAGDSSQWAIGAVASFNFWEWGRSKAGVEISKVKLNQAINTLTSLMDNTKLEVTTNFQNLVSASRNIVVASKAVESAAEDLRMVTERYQEQVATNTEVLDAQTRYSQAQYDYFQALYNYNLAWASLERTMGRKVTPAGLTPNGGAPQEATAVRPASPPPTL